MVYPWSKKAKEEVPDKIEVTEDKDITVNEDSNIESDDEIITDTENKKETKVWDNNDPRAILLNILKLEGYKMDSGELFNAYREASGEAESSTIMESFKNGLDQLSDLGKIRSDSNGNIMTIQDYDREKSQTNSNEEKEETIEEIPEEIIEEVPEETIEEIPEKVEEDNLTDIKEIKDESIEDNEDLESIIKLKEETDSWLIEKLKNNTSNNEDTELRKEVKELKDRIEKLESVIKNITKAFE
jgi:hypothetical protein|tara:strand:- start:5757 stop:6485 length:729 start_codon:yes stop_codon:yes gene_type:complete